MVFEIEVYLREGLRQTWWEYKIDGVACDGVYLTRWGARAAAKRKCRQIVREARRHKTNTFTYEVKED